MIDGKESHVLAAAALLGLTIDPSMLEGVADNLALLRLHAANVLALALADEEEIACVFRA